jgi:hypothetical protein
MAAIRSGRKAKREFAGQSEGESVERAPEKVPTVSPFYLLTRKLKNAVELQGAERSFAVGNNDGVRLATCVARALE